MHLWGDLLPDLHVFTDGPLAASCLLRGVRDECRYEGGEIRRFTPLAPRCLIPRRTALLRLRVALQVQPLPLCRVGQAVSGEAMAEVRRKSQKAFGYGGPDSIMAALEQEDAESKPST